MLMKTGFVLTAQLVYGTKGLTKIFWSSKVPPCASRLKRYRFSPESDLDIFTECNFPKLLRVIPMSLPVNESAADLAGVRIFGISIPPRTV